MLTEIAFEATCLVCLLVCIGIFDSQVTIMFFDKAIDAIAPTLATYAAALLAPVVARAFGARRAVAVSACALGLASGIATLVRAEWIEVFAAAIGFIAGSWWLALVAGSRVPGRPSTLATAVPVGIAAAFVIRAAARTLSLDGAPLLASFFVLERLGPFAWPQ